MSELLRDASGGLESDDDDDDIFKSNFSHADAGKVKIAGGSTGLQVGLATAKLQKDCQINYDKDIPVKSTFSTSVDPANATLLAQQHPGGEVRSSSSSAENEEEDETDGFVEISVSEPTKVGEGISSYLVYRVTTRTNLPFFKRPHFSVSRRFSDFLGLHEKLSERHLSTGRVIPPAPEKSLLGATKVKMSSSNNVAEAAAVAAAATNNGEDQEGDGGGAGKGGVGPGGSGGPGSGGGNRPHCTDQAEFIARRRFALERFINRVAAHPVLRRDAATVRFLEAAGDLPRATSTSALSSASVMRLFGRVSDTVAVKAAAHKGAAAAAVAAVTSSSAEDADPWYREKTPHLEALEKQLRRLMTLAEGVVQCRHELAVAAGAFAQSAAALSSAEEAHSLSRALALLARAEERVEAVHHRQAEADYFHLLELLKDYVALSGAVKDAFHERAKAAAAWDSARAMLLKKREHRARLEMSGRVEKLPAADEEVREWERRVEQGGERFRRVSAVIKTEVELFERYRVRDFKSAVIRYLEALMNCQLQLVKQWEEFLPEAKSILF